MAQSSAFDIIASFKIADLKQELDNFKHETKDLLTIAPKLGGSKTLIISEFEDIIKTLEEQMKKGEIDPSVLGLNKLLSKITIFYQNFSKMTGDAVSQDLKNLNEQLEVVSDKVAEYATKMGDLEKERGKLESSQFIRNLAKEETGFTGRVMHGGTKEEALDYLKTLKEIPEEQQKSNSQIQKQIELYEALVKQYEKAEQRLSDLAKEETNIINKNTQALKDKADLQKQIDSELVDSSKKQTGTAQKLSEVVARIGVLERKLLQTKSDLTKEQRRQNKVNKEAVDVNNKHSNTLTAKATRAFSLYVVFSQLRRVFNDTLRTIKQLDKAMTEAAVVTSMNRKEAWALLGTYQELARQTGVATSEIAGVVTQFLRQGRSIKDALELTEVAAKSARVASISAKEAVDFLTSAVNGFGLAASQAEEVADRFAAIAARSATSFEELAIAMSKVAPTAKSAGIGIDFMMGVIAKGIETTREAPENIGTAFKTIFARMREVTDLGKAMEDGMDLNRVERALLSVDVPLRDLTGQFRNLEDVLIDVGNKWETLTSVEQAYLATALAGSRQQPRLLAIFNDFARTKELIQISADSTGQLANQHVEFMKGSEAALTNLRTAWESFTMSFIETQIIIDITQTFANILTSLSRTFEGVATAGQFMTTILIGLAAAFVILNSQKVINTALTALHSLAINTGAGFLNAKGKAVRMNAAELKALTATQKLNMLTTNLSALSFGKVTTAIKLKTAALGKLLMALGPLLLKLAPFIALAALATLAIGAFNKRMEIARRGATYFAEEVGKVNNEINRLGTRQREVKQLVDRFGELASKAARTTEELKEMQGLVEQLDTVELDGEVFNLTRQDITGKIVIDQGEYDRYLKFIDDKRQELLQKNIETFQQSIAKDFEGTLNNRTLMNIFAQIGFDFAQQFIEGLEEGLSDEIINTLTAAGRQAGQFIRPENFIQDDQFFIGASAGNLARFGQDALGNRIMFNSREEALDFISNLLEAGRITTTEAIGLESNIIRQIGTGEVDLDAYQSFINSLLSTIQLTFSELEKDIEKIIESTDEGVERNAAIFEAQANAYQTAVESIIKQAQEEDWTPEKLQQTLEFVGATMTDQAVLHDLIKNKKIDAKVIATMSVDISIEEIDKLFSDLQDILDGTHSLSHLQAGDLFGKTLTNLFSNTADGVEKGFLQLKARMDFLVRSGAMLQSEADRLIIRIANSVKTMSVGDVAGMLQEQMNLAKQMFDLSNQLAKGDFSNFAKLVETFGLEATKQILSKDTELLEEFFKEQSVVAIDQINESIKKIQGTAIALNRELTDHERQQIAAYEMLIQYYEELAIQEQLRNFRLSTAAGLLKQMTDSLTLQQKLAELGFTGGIFDVFSDMADKYYSEGLGFLIDQVEVDLNRLGDFMDEEGFFTADDLGLGEAAIQNAVQSLTQLVDAVTEAYNRQKKAIEERYQGEIDAIKKSHSERWSMIDYTDRLLEAEEKILEARRRLMGLAVSGVSKGMIDQAEKDLRKLQQERQRIIEDQAIEQAEKELERKMQEELVDVQKELTGVLEGFAKNLEEYQNVLLRIFATEPVVEPEDRVRETISSRIDEVGDLMSVMPDLTIATVDLTTATKDLTAAILGLTEVEEEVTEALENITLLPGKGNKLNIPGVNIWDGMGRV